MPPLEPAAVGSQCSGNCAGACFTVKGQDLVRENFHKLLVASPLPNSPISTPSSMWDTEDLRKTMSFNLGALHAPKQCREHLIYSWGKKKLGRINPDVSRNSGSHLNTELFVVELTPGFSIPPKVTLILISELLSNYKC